MFEKDDQRNSLKYHSFPGIHHMNELKNQQNSQKTSELSVRKSREALKILDLSIGHFHEKCLFFVISDEKDEKRKLQFGGHAAKV